MRTLTRCVAWHKQGRNRHTVGLNVRKCFVCVLLLLLLSSMQLCHLLCLPLLLQMRCLLLSWLLLLNWLLLLPPLLLLLL
eukprot:COSAG01_NODE_4019_length_5428_cov_16.226454_2_plen_80_part_00